MITNTSEAHLAIIQIVDDNPENLALLSSALAIQGYEVHTAVNGTLALKSAQKHPADLILLDIMMPKMNGYEVCRQLKADERTRDIPVIFLSALNETLDKVKAFSVGGVDYITKPFQPDEVLTRIETHLSLRRLQKQLEAQNAQLQQEVIKREQAEHQIRAQHTFLKTILDSLLYPFYVINVADYTVEMANAAAMAIAAADAGNLQGQATCYALTHHVDQPCATREQPCPLSEVKKSRQPAMTEHVHFDREGKARYVEIHGYPIFDRAGNVVQMIEYALDITERKQIEGQRERLAALEERERIGRELHDDLGQVVSSMGVQAQAAQELMGLGKTAQAQAILAQLVQMSDEANDDVRQYMLGIRTSERIPGIRTSERIPGVRTSERIPGVRTSEWIPGVRTATTQPPSDFLTALDRYLDRSEERRVGKECRSRWSPYH